MFVDETFINTKMTRLRGRSRKGERLRASAPFGHWKTHTFIAGLRCHELSAPWVIDGPMTRSAFEAYVETQLAPTLAKGDVVILDNLAVHKSVKAAQCLRQKGAWFLFLPAYSPDLNPHRAGLLKAQSAPAQSPSPNPRCALASHRRHLRLVRASGVLELPQSRWICVQLNIRCSLALETDLGAIAR